MNRVFSSACNARQFRVFLALLGFALSAHAQNSADQPVPVAVEPPPTRSEPEAEQFSVHGQFTNVTQKHATLHSPYEGPNSLHASEQAAETVDLTLFTGVRLWSGGELYLNPEIDQGFGLSNTLGVAAFPSGEAYKIGDWRPYYRMPRAFLRQTFALAGGQTKVDAGPNALAGTRPDNSLTLTLGKFSVVDIFDTNAYAHDPRADFLNWAVVESGAFDYAADSWGYTLGAALEWQQGDWTLRAGYFALSTVPNSESLENNFSQNSVVGEIERRFKLIDRPGTIRVLAFVDRGNLARYDDAVALAATTHSTPEVASVRRGGSKSGYAANIQQEVAEGIGIFARMSANNGRYEAIEFSEINRSIAAGLSVKGSRWGRPDDALGAAAVIDGLSAEARAYFAAGGNGVLIGDGQLAHYGSERIIETYYAVRVNRTLSLGADFQHVSNPAYNRDRGPVRIYGLRVHAEF
jgi:high affinity Mn2+ porin